LVIETQGERLCDSENCYDVVMDNKNVDTKMDSMLTIFTVI